MTKVKIDDANEVKSYNFDKSVKTSQKYFVISSENTLEFEIVNIENDVRIPLKRKLLKDDKTPIFLLSKGQNFFAF